MPLVHSCGRRNTNPGDSYKVFGIAYVLTWCRNRIPWIAITVIFGVCVVMFLVLRSYLSWQNEKRERESHDDSYDNVYLTYVDEKGNSTERRVDKVGCSGFLVYILRAHLVINTGIPWYHWHPEPRVPLYTLNYIYILDTPSFVCSIFVTIFFGSHYWNIDCNWYPVF